MTTSVREQIEQRELDNLSPRAAKASQSIGRVREEPQDPVRTCFQRDRDRILHSKSFRRLKHKTQVFIEPSGDHYRTRMTHSLEVAQIARTIGRALLLNEDLIEAIALGHDVGHTPFGHAGEDALNASILDVIERHPSLPSGFRHFEQSLRVVDVLDNLNLSEEVRQGIGGHSKGRKDLTAFDGEPTSTLEAAVVRIADRIAYLNHDLDDALRSNIIDRIPDEFLEMGKGHSQRISSMVLDTITCSTNESAILLSEAMLSKMNRLKEWLFENVYLRYPLVYPDIDKAKGLVRELFFHYVEGGEMPPEFVGAQGAVDYVAGMTDRYAISTYAKLKLPAGFRELPALP